MRAMLRVGWLALAVLGCSGSYSRVSLLAGSSDGLLYSNLLVLKEWREPRVEHGTLFVDYSLLFENVGNRDASFDLRQAEARLNGTEDTATIDCHQFEYRSLPFFVVGAGNRNRLDCTLALTPNGQRLLSASDSELAFRVFPEGRAPLYFLFRLKREDAP